MPISVIRSEEDTDRLWRKTSLSPLPDNPLSNTALSIHLSQSFMKAAYRNTVMMYLQEQGLLASGLQTLTDYGERGFWGLAAPTSNKLFLARSAK